MSENNYVGYEYKTVEVAKELDLLWRDGMANFGWELERRTPVTVKPVWWPIRIMLAPLALIPGTPFRKMIMDHESETEVELTFRRDKHIAGKAELDRLQTRFETQARGIETLEDSKSSGAKVGAFVIGFLGTVFMAVSVFSMLAEMLPMMIIAAIPGLLAWVLSYFIYKKMKGKKTLDIEPQIEKQHESIHDICQKASGILVGTMN